uniref:Uncharacterized protein n=1 Tax=Anguilla anguilla TaxID=7936 RepID=A0A0E9PEE3_ANGAN
MKKNYLQDSVTHSLPLTSVHSFSIQTNGLKSSRLRVQSKPLTETGFNFEQLQVFTHSALKASLIL